MSILEEFKIFATRGNVVDLAVAVVVGGAFGKIVTSLVDTIIMPSIGLFIGGVDFTGLVFTVGEATIAYGRFLQSIVDFISIAFVIFIVLRTFNRFERKTEKEKVSKPSEEVMLLREIRDNTRR